MGKWSRKNWRNMTCDNEACQNQQQFLACPVQEDSIPRMKIKPFLIECCYFNRCEKLYKETLKKELKSEVLEKKDFQSQDESKLRTVLLFFDYQDTNAEHIWSFSEPMLLKKEIFCAWHLWGIYQATVIDANELEWRVVTIRRMFWHSLNIPIPTQGAKISEILT